MIDDDSSELDYNRVYREITVVTKHLPAAGLSAAPSESLADMPADWSRGPGEGYEEQPCMWTHQL